MSDYTPRIIIPGKMVRTPSGKIARCPAFQYEFAKTGFIDCFVNPDPPEWDSGSIYSLHDSVKYDSKLWYSTIVGENQGNTPGVFGWQNMFNLSCENEDWDSVSPFGGVGKHPKYYALSVDAFFRYDYDIYGENPFGSGIWELETIWRKQYKFRYYYVATKSGRGYGSTAEKTDGRIDYYQFQQYHGIVYADCSATVNPPIPGTIDFCTGIASPHNTKITFGPDIKANGWTPDEDCFVTGLPSVSPRPPWVKEFNGFGRIEVDEAECKLVGSKNDSLLLHTPWGGGNPSWIDEEYSYSVSWRPLDCNYELWDSEKEYFKGDCVAWLGRFYRACKPPRGAGAVLEEDININREPEEDASNTCEFGFFWRLA